MTFDPVARYLSERAVKSGRRARLRPMGTSETLDLAVRIYRSLGLTFLRVSLVPSLFCLASLAFTFEYVLPAMFSTKNSNSSTVQAGEASIALVLALLVGAPLFLLGLSYTSALVVGMASDQLLGRPVDEAKVQRSAAQNLPKLFWVSLRELGLSTCGMVASILLMFASAFLTDITSDSSATAGIVAVLAICGFIGGIGVFLFVVATHSLAAPVAILEGVKAGAAARRSKFLMKATKYHVSAISTVFGLYGLLFVVAIIVWGGSAIAYDLTGVREIIENVTLDLPFQTVLLSAFDLSPLFLMVWALVPMWAVTITVIYYERRIRLEGYDIETLAADI